MFSMIDPKGYRPKVQGKSHSFNLAEQHQILGAAYETRLWPAIKLVPAEPDALLEDTR